MAGIGFEIRKILKKNTLLSVFEAYGYAGLIGSGPWLLSIIALSTPRNNSTSTRFKKWILPLSSLCLVILQFLTLNWLILETSYPTCATHSNCNTGEYCISPYLHSGTSYTP